MANFGVSVGDVVTVGSPAWNAYRACRSASSEFPELARELIGLHAAVKELGKEASKPDTIIGRLGEQKQKELQTIVQNIGEVLVQVQKVLSKYSSLSMAERRNRDVVHFSAEDLQDLRSKVILHANAVNLFLGSLSVTSLGHIESMLDDIVKELQRGNATVPHWRFPTTRMILVRGSNGEP